MRIILATMVVALSACSTFQNLVSDNPVTEAFASAPAPVRYTENPNHGAPADRRYRRMTKSRMEEEAELHSQAGSMWVQDGQTSYLFVQNKTRREGDILSVKLEGAALRQVETKVGVIKKLLKQLEDQQNAELQQRMAAQNPDANRAPASTTAAAPAAKPAGDKKAKEEKEDLSDVQNVSTRIVERLADGNYRVKGQQPFMIGKREYKVLVTGMIRPEDFNDEGVSSSKLLDPQYDVVSVRRKNNEQL